MKRTINIGPPVLMITMLVLTAFHEWFALALFLFGSYVGALMASED